MFEIFINYRHDDSKDSAGRLHAALSNRFGADRVFLDITGIVAGEDIEQRVRGRIGASRVLLVLIGRAWSGVRDDQSRPRLAAAGDPVRLEIAEAFTTGLPVIPVLLHGAVMPERDRLPPDIQALAGLKAANLRHESWDTDLAQLTAELSRYVKPKGSGSAWLQGLRAVVGLVGLARRLIVGLLLLVTLGLLARWAFWAEVPSLTGLPVQAATLILDSHLIEYEVAEVDTPATGLAARVVDQRPPAGRLATRLGGVALWVAPGRLSETLPADSPPASDAELRRAVLGTWRQIRSFNGWLVDQQTTLMADGRSETRGVATLLGAETKYVLRATWTITDGRLVTQAEFSSVPGALPVGSRSEDEIIAVSEDELATRSLLDGRLQVDLRVR